MYQDLVRKENDWYIDGTETLLNELIEKEISFTIATTSPKISVDFYIDYFEHGRWFRCEDIVYDDGNFPGKPDSTIYKKAAEGLELKPVDCVVVEDAVTGVQSANRTEIEKVIIMSYYLNRGNYLKQVIWNMR